MGSCREFCAAPGTVMGLSFEIFVSCSLISALLRRRVTVGDCLGLNSEWLSAYSCSRSWLW